MGAAKARGARVYRTAGTGLSDSTKRRRARDERRGAGGGGRVGESRSFISITNLLIIIITINKDSKIPNHLRSIFVCDIAIVRVSIP